MGPTLSPTAGPTDKLTLEPRGDDQCDSETVTTLDLFKSEVSTPGTTDNNLQNGGRLVYKNAGKVTQSSGPDKKLSLIITKRPGTTYFSFKAGGPADSVNSNGKNGQFGSINIQNRPADNADQIGEGKFDFCVVDAETEEPLELDFNFFFFDLDNRKTKNGKLGLVESIEVFGYDELVETDVTPKTYSLHEEVDSAVVTATAVTGKLDNPDDPNNLTDVQLGKSIGFSFKSTSCFEVDMFLKCPSTSKQCTPNGANILFSGKANQIIQEPCPEPPTGSPTVGPTVGPTLSPTAGPTNKLTPEPRSDCPVFEEGTGTSVCGAGENVVHFIGEGSQCESTSLSEDGEDPFYDIEFLANQNVAFKVRNPFAPDGGKLFIDYAEPVDGFVSNQQCIQVDECSSESIKASCSKHAGSTVVSLYYVYDGLTCEEDKLKAVPDCCHPDEEVAGTEALVLSYLVQCSCHAETTTRFLRSH